MSGANDKVVLALIGAGGRGTVVIRDMQKCLPGIEVRYVCDVDEERGGRVITELEKQQGRKPLRVEDMRRTFEDKDVDGVVICTPEHWHALATVWACQAGKDVYVEKNITMDITEGQKMIEASVKYNRIVECGWQNRSGDYNFEARDYIQSGKLGKIALIKIYGMTNGEKPLIMKEDEPAPKGLNWDMWLGPAPLVPYNISRHKSYNDWWDYSCGFQLADTSHAIDLVRMVTGDPGHPLSVFCTGGRVLFDDSREIPDNQTVTFDFGDFPMTVEASVYGDYLNKASTRIRFTRELFPNWIQNGDRVEIYGTEGVMYLGRTGGGWQVFGKDSEIIAQGFGYNPDVAHQKDFINSIRTRKKPNAAIEVCHKSAVLVHLANLSYRTGEKQLLFDASTEKVTNSEKATELCRRIYRKGYEMPEKI